MKDSRKTVKIKHSAKAVPTKRSSGMVRTAGARLGVGHGVANFGEDPAIFGVIVKVTGPNGREWHVDHSSKRSLHDYVDTRIAHPVHGMSIVRLSRVMDIDDQDWSGIMGVSKSTIGRMKKKEDLDKLSSEKVAELEVLYSFGIEVFEDEDKFRSWINTENINFDERRPKDFIGTSAGIDMINTELTRIEHSMIF